MAPILWHLFHTILDLEKLPDIGTLSFISPLLEVKGPGRAWVLQAYDFDRRDSLGPGKDNTKETDRPCREICESQHGFPY